MPDERWFDRQLPEKASNDLVRAPLTLFLGALPRYPPFEVGAPGRRGNAGGRDDPSAVAPGAGDRELAAMSEARELGREVPLAQRETRAQCIAVRENAAEACRETRHAPEYRLDDAMVIEQI